MTPNPKPLTPPGVRLPTSVRPIDETLDLTLDPSLDHYDGNVTIHLELSEGADVIWLNAADLRIDSATVGSDSATVSAHDDQVALVLPSPVQAGPTTLRLHYTAPLPENESSGIYRRQDGDDWYAFTDFEPMDARRAFPCFDQPELKIPWRLTLHIPSAATAVSNTPVGKETEDADGTHKAIEFLPTKPLPSYLVAFAVGPLASTPVAGAKIPYRIVYPRGHADQAAYPAAESGPFLTALEDYFGIPYPYDKLDLLAVPALGPGAMENPGLITFRGTRILHDPADWSLRRRRGYIGTAVHELAHQWFGDLVTLAWWDDIWLNEAFASWMADKIVGRLYPAWNQAVDDADERAEATLADARPTARKIRQPVDSRDAALDAFDSITYAKGATVIHMFEEWIGEDMFRSGVTAYLKKHRHGNATAADFLASLGEAAHLDVAKLFSPFLDQPGVPVITMELRCPAGGKASLALSQARYTPLGAHLTGEQPWQIPVCVRWGDKGKKAAPQQACTLLTGETGTWEIPGAGACPAWLVPNANAIGYYLVEPLGKTTAAAIAAAAKQLTPAERVGAYLDLRMSVTSGATAVADVLPRLADLGADKDAAVLRATLGLAALLDDRLFAGAPGEDRARWSALLRKAYGKRARALGWLPKAKESDDDALLRPALLALVAGPGQDGKLAAEARTLAERWLADRKAVPAEIVDSVLQVAARNADRKLFDAMTAALVSSKEASDRRTLLDAIAQVRDPALVSAALALVLDATLPPRDGRTLLLQLARNDAAVAAAYAYVQDHFDALIARMPRDFGGQLPSVGAGYCDAARAEDVRGWFAPRVKDFTGGDIELDHTLDEITLCAAFRAAHQAGAFAWLKQHGGK